MKTLTYTQTAWAYNPEMLQDILVHGGQPSLQNIYTDMSTEGWIKVGTATVTVELLEESDIKLSAVAQCNEAIKKVRADTEVKVAHLEQMIQNLLAIEYTEPVTAQVPVEEGFDPTKPYPTVAPMPMQFPDIDDDILF